MNANEIKARIDSLETELDRATREWGNLAPADPRKGEARHRMHKARAALESARESLAFHNRYNP